MKKSKKTFASEPAEPIVLREDKKWRNLVLLVLFLGIGMFFLGRGINMALTKQGGWTEIEVRVGSPGCAEEFSFRYLLDDKNGNAEYRALYELYTDACEREAKLYNSEEAFPDVGNLYTLNASPNREILLEPELYRALEEIRDSGSRTVYLAPLYSEYMPLFFSETDEEALVYDPLRNEELARRFEMLAAFAGDPAQIDVELLGENRAVLRISEAYLQLAQENNIGTFVDFGWMKNAFILDDLAETVRRAGFTRGYIQSDDGFGRNLCETKETLLLNVFDRAFSGDYFIAQLSYDRPLSFVSLHSYARKPARNDLYYEYADGATRAIYLDPADGLPRTAIDDLLLWSDTRSCGELALLAERAFVTASFDTALAGRADLYCAFCEDRTLRCSDPAVVVQKLAEGYGLEQAA